MYNIIIFVHNNEHYYEKQKTNPIPKTSNDFGANG